MEINNNITELTCSFKISKLLKEKGYLVTPDSNYFTENGVNGICTIGGPTWEKLKNGEGTDIICPTQALAVKWIRENLNWHLELIWDIENGKIMWYCSLSQIGELAQKCIDLKFENSAEEAIEAAISYALGEKPVEKVTIGGIDYDSIKDAVLEEYAKGNVVVSGFEGIQAMPLVEFVKQPAQGILYDLNRNEMVVLTFIKDQKWINDYAVAKVIQELKRQLEEKK